LFGFIAPSVTFGQSLASPEELFGTLFQDIQNSNIFSDSKTFADCIPSADPVLIIESYYQQKNKEGFNLQDFVKMYFRTPAAIKTSYVSDTSLSTEEHIRKLWPYLTRQPRDQERGGSLIPLPFPYIVPGGRFREIYYWDSYFTMLGLKECGRVDLIENMINNFAYLINTFGHVPTGNRTYYLSRSQPPFFSLMVRLYSEMEGKKMLKKYLPQMRKEYDYWMDEGNSDGEDFTANRRVVRLPDGVRLNRYWDDKATPRPEAYHEDVALAEQPQRIIRLLKR
jgi:alpha,alpha-trehalase